MHVETLNSIYCVNYPISVGELRKRIHHEDRESSILPVENISLLQNNVVLEDSINLDFNSRNLNIVLKRYPSYYELLGLSWYWNVIAIIFGVLFVAASAQISFNLPDAWSQLVNQKIPVPISFQTWAVFLVGPMFGPYLSITIMILYWLCIAAGLPFGAMQKGGWKVVFGSTGGYFIGMIIGVSIASLLSTRGYDRQYRYAISIMVAVNLIIYICGLVWLPFGLSNVNVCGHSYGCVGNVLMWGLVPFIPGDIIKIILAWILLPIGWKLLGKKNVLIQEKIVAFV